MEEGSSLCEGLEHRTEQAAQEEEEVGAARLLTELEGDRPGEGSCHCLPTASFPSGFPQRTLKYRPLASSKSSLSLSVKSPLGFHSSLVLKRCRPVSQACWEPGVWGPGEPLVSIRLSEIQPWPPDQVHGRLGMWRYNQ